MTHNKQQTDCALLRLPPELRNKVYDACLITQAPINVTSGLQQPNLLATCRQIRREAPPLYCSANDFKFIITDMDATSLFGFFGHVSAIHKPPVYFAIGLQGEKNWCNLVWWCEVAHRCWRENKIGAGPRNALRDADGDGAVVGAAHRIAMDKGKTWEECVVELEELRLLVGKFDGEWLQYRRTKCHAVSAPGLCAKSY